MYQYSYAEVLDDDQAQARRQEAYALDHAAKLLRRAAELPHPSIDGVKALHFTRQLWMTLTTELAAPDNALPREIRANLISIGLWILREADAIRLDKSKNYAGIADVCTIVRDGLL